MSSQLLAEYAANILVGFLLSLGIPSNDGEDSVEMRDCGPHCVYTQVAQVPPALTGDIDPAETLEKLVQYVTHHNAFPGAVRFEAYNVQAYVCPCGCGTFLYVSISHTA